MSTQINAPTLEILAIQTEQVVRQINAIIGHVAAHGSRENISPALQGAASLALVQAQRAATQAYGYIAAARKPLNPDSMEAAQEAMSRG